MMLSKIIGGPLKGGKSKLAVDKPKHGSSDGSALDSRPRGPGFESRWIL